MDAKQIKDSIAQINIKLYLIRVLKFNTALNLNLYVGKKWQCIIFYAQVQTTSLQFQKGKEHYH